jgi:hypothetical protein
MRELQSMLLVYAAKSSRLQVQNSDDDRSCLSLEVLSGSDLQSNTLASWQNPRSISFMVLRLFISRKDVARLVRQV